MLLLNGDCIEQMQKLKDEGKQIDSVVTDPPYHLTSIVERYGKEGSAPAKDKDGLYQRQARGFMGKEWDGGDIAFRTDTWKLAYDLLKPGGHLLAFSASRNYHRMAVAIEDAGFEIRDQIMWIYGSGFPKSLNLGDGWGTALKPAHEPIVMAKKFIEGTNKNNREKYGTGGINIDGCRIETEENLNGGAYAKNGNRGSLVSDIRSGASEGMFQSKKTVGEDFVQPTGRFPANVMHDGSDVVQDIFPKTSKSSGGGGSKTVSPSDNVYQGGWGHKEYDKTIGFGDEGSASRYFYCPKTSKSERNQGLIEFDDKQYSHDGRKKSIENPYQRNKSVSKNSHPTVKPVELMKYLCRLVTPKGGTVLDPFMGSGSTGMAAKDEGFNFIGIEREKEYFKISEQRIKTTAPLSEFFT